MVEFLSNEYFRAILVPLLFIAIGICAKKLVRSSNGWQKTDWFLGMELMLGTVSTSLVHLIEVFNKNIRSASNTPATKAKINTAQSVFQDLTASTTFTILVIALFFVVMALYKDFHSDFNTSSTPNPKHEYIVVGIVCNLVGLIFMYTFVLGIKGV